MPFFFSLLEKYPWTTLAACGTAVGLPEGMAGNSAVGHFTIGAGEVIEQPLTQFSRLIRENKLADLPVIKNNFTHLAQTGKTLHILGLISDGGSHSKVEFTQAIIKTARAYGIKSILVHAILDGRDVPQKSAAQFLQQIDAPIATLQGRLYAMDRNNDTARITQGYAVLTQHEKITYTSWQQALDDYYAQGYYDETIPPTQLLPESTIQPGDGLVFVNIRADREREIYLLLKDNSDLSFVISGINYDTVPNNQVICATPHASNTIGDYLAQHKIPLFSCAESEKYAHITYFFNGGREDAHPNETRVIIESDNPESFATEPAMQAAKITDAVEKAVENHVAAFFVINYANADMVGHTGDIEATKRALTVLDEQLKRLYTLFIEKNNGTLYITSDHGNAEDKHDHNPAHTTNPVYFLAISNPPIDQAKIARIKGLSDIKNLILS